MTTSVPTISDAAQHHPATRPARPRRASRQRLQLVDELFHVFGILKHRIAAAIPEEVREELAGVTMHQLETLWLVVERDGTPMNDLARCQNVGVSSCTAVVDRLHRQGLVERAGDPDDRRVVRVLPTERGREVVARYTEARRRAALAMLESLDDDQATSFVALMRVVSGQGGTS